MIYDDKGNVRLTRSELNDLRTAAAKQGEVILDERKMTREEHLEALAAGTPLEIIEDALEFFQTGSSPLTREGGAERAVVTQKSYAEKTSGSDD